MHVLVGSEAREYDSPKLIVGSDTGLVSTIKRGLGTERARLGTFRGLCTERARLGTFRGFGTERPRLGTF